MRLGVLGGTFDPPHLGHLILAEQARDQLDLDRVLWVPAADPPHKQDQVISPAAHRVEMVLRAIQDNNQFTLSDVDEARPGPHYSVDMLSILGSQFPNAELYFIIGGDSLRDLPTWHQPDRLITLARLVVMGRPEAEYDLETLEAQIPGISNRLLTLITPLVAISGRSIRHMVGAGKSVRYLVPRAVFEYLEHHHLYQPSAE